MIKKEKEIVLVDNDISFCTNISSLFNTKKLKCIYFHDCLETNAYLDKNCKNIVGLFINPKAEIDSFFQLIEKVKSSCPTLPIFFLCDSDWNQFRYSPEKLFIQTYQKDFFVSKIQFFISLVETRLSMIEKGNDDDKSNDPEIEPETELSKDFMSVPLNHFIFDSITAYNLFLKLSDSKYIQILGGGDEVSFEKVSSYFKKGVANFFIRKTEYLERQALIADTLKHWQREMPDIDIKLSLTTAHLGREILSFLHQTRLDEATIDQSKAFVDQCIQQVQGIPYANLPFLMKYLNNVLSVTHAVGVTIIATIIMEKLGIESKQKKETIGFAAFIHDIGLNLTPDNLDLELKPFHSNPERILLRSHCYRGAHLTKQIPDIDPLIPEIILQHHERNDRSGYPNRLGKGQILKESEIVGIAEEFISHYSQNKDSTAEEIYTSFLISAKYLFSHDVFEAFVRAFSCLQNVESA